MSLVFFSTLTSPDDDDTVPSVAQQRQLPSSPLPNDSCNDGHPSPNLTRRVVLYLPNGSGRSEAEWDLDVAVYPPPGKHVFDGAQETKARQRYYDEKVLEIQR